MTEKRTGKAPDSTLSPRLVRASRRTRKHDGKNGCGKPRQAAARIARAWRRHVFTRAYRAARDLLLRRGGLVAARVDGASTDPVPADIIHDAPLALRLANPAEAALANDRGACVHVRLRLGAPHRPRYRSDVGGDAFAIVNENAPAPPSVYYRVYTHHPVADLNALAPEATFEEAKRRASREAMKATRARACANNAFPRCRRRCVTRLDLNEWRPLPPRAARALAEDERIAAEAALKALCGSRDASRETADGFARATSSRTRGRRRRERSSRASGAIDIDVDGRRSARVTNRGARAVSDAAATRAALRRRARAWSAGGYESLKKKDGGETTARDAYGDDDAYGDSAEDVDSLLEWSAGLDFEAFDVSWREAW